MRLKALLLILLFSLFTECEITPKEPLESKLVVHCLLQSGERPIRAKVNRSYKIEEHFDSVFGGASLRLFSSKGEWEFHYIAGDSYITPTPLSVEEGDTWFIQVTKEGFPPLTGRTVVPDGFNILFPRPGDTISIQDSMVWTRSKLCRGYFLSFRQIENRDTFYWDILYPNDSFSVYYDSSRVFIPRMLFLLPVTPLPDSPPKHCTLRVWALDTNYYNWLEGNGLVSETTRLIGGLGVFGSAVERGVPVVVRRFPQINR